MKEMNYRIILLSEKSHGLQGKQILLFGIMLKWIVNNEAMNF